MVLKVVFASALHRGHSHGLHGELSSSTLHGGLPSVHGGTPWVTGVTGPLDLLAAWLCEAGGGSL